ncbi:MAG: ArsI/CadI family heavy metal resistance metalloenzyme [Betaproteobacteria bacterium]
MKRFHVHLGVPDLSASIRFYTGLFGMAPSVEKSDYAKWMLDDPRVNFAISSRGRKVGLNHLGLQADSADELTDIRTQFEAADASATVAEPGANCCYVKSDKHWVTDPQGIAWEAFHTLSAIPLFGEDTQTAPAAAACCSPSAAPERASDGAAKSARCCS